MSKPKAATAPMKKHKIDRMNDDAVNISYLRWGVVFRGYCVIACMSRKRALELAEKGRLDTPDGEGIHVVDLFNLTR